MSANKVEAHLIKSWRI